MPGGRTAWALEDPRISPSRTVETETPAVADNPFESPFKTDSFSEDRLKETRKRAWKNVDRVCDAGQKVGDQIEAVLGRVRPTGQYTRQDRPDGIMGGPVASHGIDGGSAGAAMLRSSTTSPISVPARTAWSTPSIRTQPNA